MRRAVVGLPVVYYDVSGNPHPALVCEAMSDDVVRVSYLENNLWLSTGFIYRIGLGGRNVWDFVGTSGSAVDDLSSCVAESLVAELVTALTPIVNGPRDVAEAAFGRKQLAVIDAVFSRAREFVDGR